MSTLYKRNGSPYWWWSAVYKGRRVAQSTKMTNKKLAHKIKETWDFNLMIDKLEFLGFSAIPSQMVDEYFSKYSLFVEKRKSENSIDASKRVLTRFKGYLTTNKINRLNDITVSVIDGYLDSLKKKVKTNDGKGYEEVSVSPKTKKNQLQEISLMLGQAVKEDVLKSNAAKNATLPKMKKTRENRVLEPLDLEIIFNGAGGWSLYYEFLYLTGLRAGDVALLTYGNIDFKRKTIVSLIRKSRRVHEFPIHDYLINKLDKHQSKDSPIFPKLYVDTERKLKDKLAMPRKFLQALLNANDRPHATLHSFRHTFNNTLRDLGLSIEDRQVLLAHASSDVNKIYTHPNLDLASQYVNKLPTDFIKCSSIVAD